MSGQVTSLQRRLTRSLALTILVAGLVAGALDFRLAYQQAHQMQDNALRDLAMLVDAEDLAPDGLSVIEPKDRDPNERTLVFVLPRGDTIGLTVPDDLRAGYHTLEAGDASWRIFVRVADGSQRIAAAQQTRVRNGIALRSALAALLPLLALVPLLTLVAARIVRSQLAPVRQLAHTVDSRPLVGGEALPEAGVPDEIRPFVRSINSMLERISILLGEQRRFIADAAHELRSPLTALSVQTENVANAQTLAQIRERLPPLQAGIQRARRLAEQLLSLARQQAGGGLAQPADLVALARETVQELLPLAAAGEVDLGIEAPATLVAVTEPPSLALLLRNVVDNAIRHSPAGGQVTVHVREVGGDVLLVVTDEGPGIPPSERQQVFDAFYRLGNSGGGSGLGLAIVRDAATRLGGTVSFTDRDDDRRGLAFVFRFPRGTVA